jgi:hypothetical protein
MAATMSDQGETDPRVSSDEAVRILGVSVTTVRRMARDGRLRADLIQTPRLRPAYLITLPVDRSSVPPIMQASEPDLGAVDAPPPSSHQQEDRPRMDTSVRTPSDQTIAAVFQASTTPIVAPLTAAIDAYRQANERHVEQLVSQAEQIGRLKAELAVKGASQTPTMRRRGSRSRDAAGRSALEPGAAGGTR